MSLIVTNFIFILIFYCGKYSKLYFNHFKGYNLVTFSTFVMSCNHLLSLVPDYHHHPKGNLVPLKQSHPISLSPPTLSH